MAKDNKDTLNLPKTTFPMRANLVDREPKRIEHWEKFDLYKKIQNKNAQNPSFILHDGPPFTNGDVHIGTALNKILKDAILRYKSLRGYRTPYVPGWDCHGLPIEHKVSRELQKEKKDLPRHELRERCAEFSRSYISTQTKQFKRLGVLADWDSEYKTMDPAYEGEILRVFGSFVKKDLVYRSKKPVYWSIPCKTALAEAEIEYKDHSSDAIWVKFQIEDTDKEKSSNSTYIIIWTTTPWTLPANMAVAVHPDLEYVEIIDKNETYIVADKLAKAFTEKCKLENISLGRKIKGKELEGLQTKHPFAPRNSPIVLGDHVTTETGTGCVHTAPGHGIEDYLLGLKYKLDIYCPLDDRGCYIDDGLMPSELIGISVLEKNGKCPANEKVLELLKETGLLLFSEKYNHQYPHCWRSKTPVIFRAMDQWFVSLDKNNLRDEVLASVQNVKWIPEWGKSRIEGSITTRPDWCISRQRSWGVPLPAFFDEEGNAFVDSEVIDQIADKFSKEGSQIWFTRNAEELLNGLKLPKNWEGKKLTPGKDTLDVWIDSGCSHHAVLKNNPNLSWPADLYFEGSDQHRGWFQSSLWTGMIADNAAPYKSVITHGFVVGQDGKKISKSEGKPQTADSYISKYGADILRLWICSEDYRNDIPISDDIIKNIIQAYRTIRNTLKFQIGNLYDFDKNSKIEAEHLSPIDHWVLKETDTLIDSVTNAYDQFEFHKGYQLINRFCNLTLSAVYHDILKDRLYTFAPNSIQRKTSQAVIHKILNILLKLLSPVLTFTADEAYSHLKTGTDFTQNDSIHLSEWPEADPTLWNPQIANEVEALLKFRGKVNEKLEASRQAKAIGQSLDAQVIIKINTQADEFSLLNQYIEILPEILIVSQVQLIEDSNPEVTIEIKHADGVRCPRSWRWVPELVDTKEWGEVSSRCAQTLKETTAMH